MDEKTAATGLFAAGSLFGGHALNNMMGKPINKIFGAAGKSVKKVSLFKSSGEKETHKSTSNSRNNMEKKSNINKVVLNATRTERIS